MESIWKKTADLSEVTDALPTLTQDIQTEVAVIGGGMAGLLIAYQLKERGIPSVVLEAEQVAGGQTGNTTAKVTSQHGLIYQKLIDTLGEPAARQYARLNQEAITEYARIIRERKIACQWEEGFSALYSLRESAPLRTEAEAALRLGIPAEYAVQSALPFPVAGEVRFLDQAQFHPLLFLKGILPELTVYQHTRVEAVEGGELRTSGGKVLARQVVFACHYPFPVFPGELFMRMHQERSYLLALTGAADLGGGMYLGIDADNGWSLRNLRGPRDGRPLLLFGGASHRTGENRSGGRYRQLRQKAARLWPGSEEIACWSAQDCMTLDSVPYIGRYSELSPNWYLATGFQKWGMTSSMVAALLLSRMLSGEEDPRGAVFSPLRFTPRASAKTFVQEGIHSVKDLSRRIFSPPRGAFDKLPPGHGGVVELDGEKVGAYKDENGELSVVSIRCPHLGCQLEWNPDEKSWDCPCHGSRFDKDGHLLDTPAQTDLGAP